VLLIIIVSGISKFFSDGDKKEKDTERNQLKAQAAYNQGKEKEALKEYESAQKHFEAALSHDPENIVYLSSLGKTHFLSGNYNNAYKQFEKTLELNKKKYSHHHPQLVNDHNNLAMILMKSEKGRDAINHLNNALQINIVLNTKTKDRNREIADSYNNLGHAWIDLDTNKSLSYYKKALDHLFLLNEDNNLDVIKTYNNIASLYTKMGDAENPSERIYFLAGDKRGVYSRKLAKRREFYEKAIEYAENALNAAENNFNSDHPETVRGLKILGSCWLRLGDPRKSITYYNKIFSANLKRYGKKHPSVSQSYNDLGTAWLIWGDAKKAIDLFNEALNINLAVCGENSSSVVNTYKNMSSAYQAIGDSKLALKYRQKALLSQNNNK